MINDGTLESFKTASITDRDKQWRMRFVWTPAEKVYNEVFVTLTDMTGDKAASSFRVNELEFVGDGVSSERHLWVKTDDARKCWITMIDCGWRQ